MMKVGSFISVILGIVVLNGSASAASASVGKMRASASGLASSVGKNPALSPSDQKSNESAKTLSGSKLDSVTEEMVEASISEISRQTKLRVEESARKSLDNRLAHDHDLAEALNSLKQTASAF